MGHGGSAKGGKASINHRKKTLGVEKKKPTKLVGLASLKNQKKPKSVSLKNQIRSTERMLKKNLLAEIKEAQEKKLEDLKNQLALQARLATERKIVIRNKKIKFFERRKIDRSTKRLEKLQQTSTDPSQEADIKDQLAKLKEDLEYVKFFPRTEKYVSLFIGGDDADVVDKRNRLRKQIKANIMDAAASGKDLEETGNEDDALLDLNEDDFFLNGSSSDGEDASDECMDKNSREQAPSAFGKAASAISRKEAPTPRASGKAASGISKKEALTPRAFGKAASGMSQKEASTPRAFGKAEFGKAASVISSSNKNQRHNSAEAVIPPPWPSNNSFGSAHQAQTRVGFSSSKKPFIERIPLSSSINKSHSRIFSSSRNREYSNAGAGYNSNLGSNSDVHKPRRKRRPKKKKQQS